MERADAHGEAASLRKEVAQLRQRLSELEGEAAARQVAEVRAWITASKLRLCSEKIHALVWTTDMELRYTSSEGAALSHLGLVADQVVGVKLSDLFGTEDPEFPPLKASQQALHGVETSFELHWHARIYDSHIAPMRARSGHIVGTFGIAVDITEKRMTELARLREEARFRDLVEQANDIIYIQDLAGNFLSVNSAAERMTGYDRDEAVRMNMADLLEDEELDRAREMIRSKLGGLDQTTYQISIRAKDGRRIYLEVSTRLVFESGRPVAIQGIARDITERRRLEDQLRHTQKMEAVGLLAGGIAHDFNNLLTGVLGHLDLLRLDIPPNSPLIHSLDVMEKAASQAARLTAQLLGFARRGKHQNAPVDLHSVILGVQDLVRHSLNKNILILREFHAPEAAIMGDPGQMQQVFLNLALNANDAMPSGGQLTFRTEVIPGKVELGHTGPQLVAWVEDTGHGIPEELHSRIFEPFFTTKEGEKGTGMGLAMVYGIVKNHGGTVQVESRVGAGAKFRLSFPLAAAPHVLAPSSRDTATPRGKAKILLVDDEEVVREVTARMLTSLGYGVTSCTGPLDALEQYQAAGAAFDLVILDMIMPRLGGIECFCQLRAINPDVRALLVSGYGQDGAVQDALNAGMAGFLPKPFSLPMLAQTIAGLLRSTSSAQGSLSQTPA